MPQFTFHPRWKEELVCTGPGGEFVLELSMGRLTVHLPPEEAWAPRAPEWAAALWPVLKTDLEEWCRANKARIAFDPTATVR